MTPTLYVDAAERQHYVVHLGGQWWTVQAQKGAWPGRRRRNAGPSADSHRVDRLAERAILRFLGIPATCPAGHAWGLTGTVCQPCLRATERVRYQRRKAGAR